MERLSVFRLKRPPNRLVLVLSDPQIAPAGTVIVAPLLNADAFPIAAILNPVFSLGLERFALATEQMAAIPVKELGQFVTTFQEHEYAIANAINRLFFGI